MAAFWFPYTESQVPPSAAYPAGKTVARPLAIAKISAANDQSFSFVVLLDTGADSCLFPLALAVSLKLDILKMPSALTGGVGGGKSMTYYAQIVVDLGNGLQFPVYAGFTEGMNSHGFGLLGQDGFFSVCDVTFSRMQRRFTLQVP